VRFGERSDISCVSLASGGRTLPKWQCGWYGSQVEPRTERSWLGVLAVVLGMLTMVSGVIGVIVYARHLPTPAPTAAPVAVPPPPLPVPALPAPVPSSASSVPAPADSSASPRSLLSLPTPIAPFPDDATAPVPVTSGHPLWGDRNATVTLTLFGDLECPHTVALLREVLRLKARQGDDLRVAFRHRPLSQHDEGSRAARALAEIHVTRGEQAFWHALAAFARHGDALEPGALVTVLNAAGLEGFPLPSPVLRAEAQLKADVELAVALYVRDTPTLFVNGRRLTGFVPRAALEEAVERERRAAELTLASGITPARLYFERTRKNVLNLGDDPPARACVPVGDAPVLGPTGAAVTVVEFTDLECELCRQGEAALASALKTYASDVRVVWKNFPLPQHQRARLAAGVALAARGAAGDRAFWSVTRALFEPRTVLDDASLVQALTRAGLDAGALLAATKAGGYEASLERDLKLAEKLGVSGAPTYFVNGRKVPGALPAAELTALLGREIALARRVRAQGSGNVAELVCGSRP
jgi:protein-disulfide isomerase